jgi:hypothetical protein
MPAGFKLAVKGIWMQKGAASAFQHMAGICPDANSKRVRAIATLYDKRTRTIFGSQCISQPVEFDLNVLEDGLLPLDFEVFWHTYVAASEVSILLQFTMASHDERRSLVNEYCVGWCQLAVTQVRSAVM